MKLQWNLKSLDGVDARHRRSLLQRLLQRVERGIIPLRNYFNRPVRQIAREAPKPQAVRLPAHEPPEADPLHLPAHDPATRAHASGVALGAAAPTRRRRYRSAYTPPSTASAGKR